MRKRIYQMVHVYEGSLLSVAYKYFMIVIIAVSLIPLTTKEEPAFLSITEGFCLLFFVVDYILRWITADYKFANHSWVAFARYPFRMISIIDMLSILALVSSIFGWLSRFELTEALSVFRIVRVFRYSKSVRTILNILKCSKKPLIAVGSLAVGYILISAIVIFNVEPDSFETFFDAVYWSTVSLTTVGYGDIYPVTALGRSVAMISSFFGIAIVALPAGIVTAEYLNSLKNNEE
ncbi:MAG: potassium channel family protein [Oscillospiraceae bacterium]|nr:potassium channel family protein [Oscillospiraceae bacterium]